MVSLEGAPSAPSYVHPHRFLLFPVSRLMAPKSVPESRCSYSRRPRWSPKCTRQPPIVFSGDLWPSHLRPVIGSHGIEL